jgi:hypothetical protein
VDCGSGAEISEDAEDRGSTSDTSAAQPTQYKAPRAESISAMNNLKSSHQEIEILRKCYVHYVELAITSRAILKQQKITYTCSFGACTE